MEIREERLRDDILENGQIGSIDVEDGHGRTVLTGSEADRRARERLVNRLDARGLSVRIDAVGDIVGTWDPPSASSDRRPIAAGSHLDSVPEGGIFDGPLGVYAALEAVRAMQDAGLQPTRPIEVVCFTEEEGGRFETGLLGSGVAAGRHDVESALQTTDQDGRSLRELLDGIGFHGDGRVDAAGWEAWIELHVEQARRLERARIPVGVVTRIAGITNLGIEVRGEANHAGSTPMDERRDALVAAAELVAGIETIAQEVARTENPSAVATVGKVDIEPNARNVVPGRVALTVDVRGADSATIDAIVDRVRSRATRIERERTVGVTIDRYRDLPPVSLGNRCTEALRRAGDRTGVETMDLASGALHDTANVARVTDAGMLFAPSKNGVSHNPREWTDWSDCATATRILGTAIASLAGCDLQ